eukprot:scaffold2912_cov19-Tisochrysis_lutea.AAC.2
MCGALGKGMCQGCGCAQDLQESSDGASRLRLDIEKVLVSAGVQCTFEHTCMAAAAAAAAAAST